MLTGFLDRCDNTVAGWAVDLDNPSQPLKISVMVDGTEVATTLANLYRADLIPAVGSSNHGFSLDLPAISKTVLIEVIAKSATQSFNLGVKMVTLQAKVESSKQGWLFLVNDSNNTDALITGKKESISDQILPCATMMSVRAMALNAMGIAYQAIIMPEKNVVCNAMRDTPLAISEERPVRQIIRHLDRMCYSKALYPIELFQAIPDKAYNRTDTHASGYGYQLVLGELRKVMPQFYKNARVELKETISFSGDLAMHLNPAPTEVTAELVGFDVPHGAPYIDEPARAIEKNARLHNSIVHVKKNNGQGRLIVFGTSSAYYGLPAFAAPFAEVFFFWTNTLDFSLIKKLNPSCVLWVATERCLPTVADDYTGIPAVLSRFD